MVISCGGVVINKDNELLVLQKKNGYFCLPKGRVEEGESWEMTALREVKEETNIDARIIQYIDTVYYKMNVGKGKSYPKKVKWYLMEATSFDAKPQKKEGFVYTEFITIDQAKKLLDYENEKYIVRKAYKILEKNDQLYTDC